MTSSRYSKGRTSPAGRRGSVGGNGDRPVLADSPVLSITSGIGGIDGEVTSGVFKVALAEPAHPNNPPDLPLLSAIAIEDFLNPDELVNLARSTLCCIHYEQLT